MARSTLKVDTDKLANMGRQLAHLPSRSGLTHGPVPKAVASGAAVVDRAVANRAERFEREVADVGRAFAELGAALAQVGKTFVDVDGRSADAMEWR